MSLSAYDRRFVRIALEVQSKFQAKKAELDSWVPDKIEEWYEWDFDRLDMGKYEWREHQLDVLNTELSMANDELGVIEDVIEAVREKGTVAAEAALLAPIKNTLCSECCENRSWTPDPDFDQDPRSCNKILCDSDTDPYPTRCRGWGKTQEQEDSLARFDMVGELQCRMCVTGPSESEYADQAAFFVWLANHVIEDDGVRELS